MEQVVVKIKGEEINKKLTDARAQGGWWNRFYVGVSEEPSHDEHCQSDNDGQVEQSEANFMKNQISIRL